MFLFDIFAFEIIYAAGYPNNKQIIVDMAAKNMESHNMFKYSESKNLKKFCKVKFIVVIPSESFVVRLYNNTRNDGKTINIIIHTK